jgi:uncharacterized protein (DUF1810 family)
MTLFHRADPTEPMFRRVIDRFFAGDLDARTDAVLSMSPIAPSGKRD